MWKNLDQTPPGTTTTRAAHHSKGKVKYRHIDDISLYIVSVADEVCLPADFITAYRGRNTWDSTFQRRALKVSVIPVPALKAAIAFLIKQKGPPPNLLSSTEL